MVCLQSCVLRHNSLNNNEVIPVHVSAANEMSAVAIVIMKI